MNYHSLSVKEVFKDVNSKETGLSEKEVEERLEKYGQNKLKKTRKFHSLKIFLEQFKSFLIIILVLAAFISFFMESKIDAIVIFLIIFLNAGLGFFQEYKSEKAIEELQKMMVPKTNVLRNGKIVTINSELLVPGDILIINEGDRIMADSRIIKCDGLKVNEASLTGESVPVEKTVLILKDSVSLADRTNMVYQGTIVVGGSGRAIVVGTGNQSEIGRISQLVQEVKAETNPFKEKIDHFAKQVGIFIIFLCFFVVIMLYLSGTKLFDSLFVSISLAVSAIPEGLPAVISLSLAIATRGMLAKNVLVRKLPASETLGRVTVICTDKTGTLTQEKMKVTSIFVNRSFNPNKGKDFLLKVGLLCNKAKYQINDEGTKYFIGDPTEIALINAAEDNFLDKKKLTEEEKKIKEFPFSSERKMMSVVRVKGRVTCSYVKGAPEKVIERCDYELYNGRKIKLDKFKRNELLKVHETLAKKGLRVLCFAYKEVNPKQLTEDNCEKGLIFVGYEGMIDPPRVEVKDSIKLCNDAGIKVIMITGDSKHTAEAISKDIGLTGKSIDSSELAKLSDKDLKSIISDVCVFSRISAEDKLRIINVLKSKGEIVAMTGDGVNDSLALKRADIGISMGIRGTEVARDSSDIILTDDNFASIVEGVREGRRIYDNIKKFIMFLLAANFYEVIFVLMIILIFRVPEALPLLPLQILWINLVTDSFPALALSVEPHEKDIMKRKPGKEGILSGILCFIIISGIVGLVLLSIVFFMYISDIDKARTMAVTTSIIYQMFLVFNCKSRKSIFKSAFNKYLVYSVALSIILHLIVLYSSLNKYFYFVKLGLNDWFIIVGFGFLGFVIMELLKKQDCKLKFLKSKSF